MVLLNSYRIFMQNNTTHNLISQLTTESKSLWRIENYYIDDCVSKQDDESLKLWKALKTQKKKNIEKLEVLIKKNM